MIRKFLSGVPFVLLNLSAEAGGGSGGGSSSSEQKPAEPAGDTPEAKYSSALKIIGDYFKQLGGAMKERDDEQAAHSVTKDLLKAEQDGHTATKGQLDAANSQLSTLNSQLVGVTKERGDARGRVTLIESYAKHHNLDLAGLDKFQAVKEVSGGGPQSDNAEGKALYDKWQHLKKTDSAAATVFFRENKKALREYSKSQGK